MNMTGQTVDRGTRAAERTRRGRRPHPWALVVVLLAGIARPGCADEAPAKYVFRTTGPTTSLFKPDPTAPPGAEWGAPVFSVWRDLPDYTHVFTDLEFLASSGPDYAQPPPPLDDASADTCCAAHPGQPLTLVRDGMVVAVGTVGHLYAADVPSGAASQLVYFDAEGMPDSLVDGRQMPQLAPFGDRPRRDTFDLYVVGRTDVAACAPGPRAWDPAPDEMKAIVVAGLAGHAIHRGGLPWSLVQPGVAEVDDAAAACLAELMRTQGVLTAYPLASPDGRPVEVQTLSLRTSTPGDHAYVDFVRVHGPGLAEPVLIAGRLQYFIRVGDVSCMVLIDALPNTGAWGYRVYALLGDRVELLLSDSAWST